MADTVRTYPHLPGVKDDQAKSALRILFDRIFDLQDQVASATTTATTANATASANATSLSTLQVQINRQALNSGQSPVANPGGSYAYPSQPFVGTGPAVIPGSSGGTGGGTGGGGTGGGGGGGPLTDGGLGDKGCTEAGPTGHVPAGSPLTPETAGKIVCGTGNEFPSLLAAVGSQATRTANVATLIGRMVYHLQLAGFTASNYPVENPQYHVFIGSMTTCPGCQYIYRVIDYSATNIAVAFPTVMVLHSITPNFPVPNSGQIPD